jgi:cytoskeletal protein RodZ
MAQLETEKYSISPNSGRLRKRVKKTSENSGLFKKRLDNFSFNSKVIFVVMLLVLSGILYFAFIQFQKEKEEVTTKYMPSQYKYVNPNATNK